MKKLYYAMFLVFAIILLAGVNGYSQDNGDDGKVVKEQDGNPVYKQDDGNKVVTPPETIKTDEQKEEETLEEVIEKKKKERKEKDGGEINTDVEGIEGKQDGDGSEIKEKFKEEKEKIKEDEENGKSESRGNKDKNNDSPLDHDQGKGNDKKIKDGDE